MIDRTLSKRYAQALLDVAVKRKCVREVETELVAVAHAYEMTPNIGVVVGHPSVRQADKIGLVRTIFGSRVRVELLEFLLVLMEKRRFELLPEIAKVYDALADEFEGLVRVQVRSFLPLTPEERQRLIDTLSKMSGGRKVAVNEEEDKGLLGGMTVRIGDVLVDGSVRGRLGKLREAMLETARL